MLVTSDFLVIGAGVAGLSFALKAAASGTVNIICKRALDDSTTNLAQGGIAAVLGRDDQVEYHIKDTLESGAGLSKPATVKAVVEAGPRMVRELTALGVSFTASVDHPDQPELGREGGHSRRRIIHAKDMTGAALQKCLMEKTRTSPDIQIYEYCQALDLIIDDESEPRTVLGACALDIRGERLVAFGARMVVLATGGSGKVYLYTTNPDVATGDGLAMGVRAGARAANMEFFQFHPTCLYHPEMRNFLISETLMGEGGRLVDKSGAAFMEKYHPLGDLAYRDVAARAIDAEMKKSGDECVFLDITHRSPDFIRDRFPSIHSVCLKAGLDMCREPLPVVPAAHYQCGGLLVDLDGRTDIRGLYAVGEVAATGLHGANRLASNSLLEALVMADRAARAGREELAAGPGPDLSRAADAPDWSGLSLGRPPGEAVVITHNWDEIRRFMWNFVGIVRSDARLKMAAARLALVKSEIEEYFQKNAVDTDLIEARNIAQVADLIIRCARLRRESRGLNYNLDWPERDDQNFKHDTVLNG